jgi:hypothetical protein
MDDRLQSVRHYDLSLPTGTSTMATSRYAVELTVDYRAYPNTVARSEHDCLKAACSAAHALANKARLEWPDSAWRVQILDGEASHPYRFPIATIAPRGYPYDCTEG